MMTIQSRSRAPSARAAFTAILFAFFCFGSLFGIWQVVLEDLKQALGIGSGALGTAMTIGFFASLPAMLAGGKIADRFGVVPVIAVSAFCIALAYVGLAVVDTYFVLIGLMLAFFGFAGVLDVGLNAAAVAYEQNTGKRALGFFHATFSAAAASSAILTGIVLTFGMNFRLLYLVVSVLLLILAALSLFGVVFPAQRRVNDETSADHTGKNRGLYRNPLILLLAFITMLGFFGESALSSWSAIYLRGSLDLPAVLGASGVAVFHIAMAVGRLSAGAAVVRFSQRTVLTAAGSIAAVGMAIALTTPQPSMILTGFLLVGLGLAVIAPIVFSIAGDIAPGRAGEATSVITVLSYGGLLLGPATIGLSAEVVGLRTALSLVIAVGIVIAILSARLSIHSAEEKRPHRQPEPLEKS